MDDSHYFICEVCIIGPCPSFDKYCPESRREAIWEPCTDNFVGGGTVRWSTPTAYWKPHPLGWGAINSPDKYGLINPCSEIENYNISPSEIRNNSSFLDMMGKQKQELNIFPTHIVSTCGKIHDNIIKEVFKESTVINPLYGLGQGKRMKKLKEMIKSDNPRWYKSIFQYASDIRLPTLRRKYGSWWSPHLEVRYLWVDPWINFIMGSRGAPMLGFRQIGCWFLLHRCIREENSE